MVFINAPLEYKQNALEPSISSKTIKFHFEKHHQGYVNKFNELLEKSPFKDLPLEDVIQKTHGLEEHKILFNNAAQIYNHAFFWKSMKPKGGGEPTGDAKSMIHENWNSYENFKNEWIQKATSLFGSGWIWLVKDKRKVRIIQTKDAETPLTEPFFKPLLTMDVWEHAYYLDYQNNRSNFTKAYLDHLVNWDFVLKNYKG